VVKTAKQREEEIRRLKEALRGQRHGKTYPVSRFMTHPVTEATTGVLAGRPLLTAASITGRYGYPDYVKGKDNNGLRGLLGYAMNDTKGGALFGGAHGATLGALLGPALSRRLPIPKSRLLAALALGGIGAGTGSVGALINRFMHRRALAGRKGTDSMFESSAEKALRREVGGKK